MENLSKDKAECLKRYLNRYYVLLIRKKQLEIRISEYRENMLSLSSPKYSDISTGRTNEISRATENKVIHLSELEKMLNVQMEKLRLATLEVESIINLLDENSIERIILEYRHIECLDWKEITRKVFLSRSRAAQIYKNAIELLLEKEKVVLLLENTKY